MAAGIGVGQILDLIEGSDDYIVLGFPVLGYLAGDFDCSAAWKSST